MKKISIKFILAFLIIMLIGAGLILGGCIMYGKKNDYVQIQATVSGGVLMREGETCTEYKPSYVTYVVDGKTYRSDVDTWFKYSISDGDKLTIWYNKNDPHSTIIGNTKANLVPYILFGLGAAVIVIGFVIAGKYIRDVKKSNMV